MRVIDIIHGTTVDGPGLRTSIYFAGCTHNCPGCHNPHTHDPMAGREMSIDEILSEIDNNGFDVTFTGGDPLMQHAELLELARAVKNRGMGIWCYTGFEYETVYADKRFSPLLDYIDVLVDGPFMQNKRDVKLRFRGSSNQRLVLVSQSEPGRVATYPESE